MVKFARVLISVLFVSAFPFAQADTILSEDFQDGNYNGWIIDGSGSPAKASLYGSNYSLNLVKRKQATRTISTLGFEQVTVTAKVAAYRLEGSDQCIAETSSNGGLDWNDIVKVVNGQDDGLTFYQETTLPSNASSNPAFQIRLRSASSGNNDYCYFDDILVTGETIVEPPACDFDCVNGNGAVTRSELSYQTLSSGSNISLVNYEHYAIPQNAANPNNNFKGVLTLSGESQSGNFNELKDSYFYTNGSDSPRKHLPAFSFEFAQHGTHLIPQQRGSVPSSHPNWEYILEPGRVWNENSDNGYTRASLPFALQQKNQNCMHNGVLSFLFKNDGTVSKVAFQIASETCSYFQFNMWGLLAANYSASSSNSQQLISDYEAEIANRMPTKPVTELANDYSNADPSQFGNINETAPAGVTVYGFIIDGVHYRGGCDTRYGSYPYCDVMSIPSYSTAKTTLGGFALLRLQKLYPNTFNRIVADYVPECDTDGDWNDVTFEHVIDMTSGNYISSDYMVDESASHVAEFFDAETHAGKIDYSCTDFPRKISPGTDWVYRTSDTYIAGTAMNTFLKETEGTTADLYQDIIVESLDELMIAQHNH